MSNTDETNERESNSEGDATRRDAYIGLTIAGLLLLALIIAATTKGFGPFESNSGSLRSPALWDWLQLLIVPAVLALGALWFNKTQKDTELKIAEKARAADREIAEKARGVDREIAEKARAADREIAESQQRQATLEAYYDRMTELLLTHNLRGSTEYPEKRSIARARTIAVIRSLDNERNQQLFSFLKASKLIEPENPVIDLSQADLSRADLSSVDLSGADLSGATLRQAVLRNANLSGANLSKADLIGANLIGANVIKANLSRTSLTWANLRNADLSGVNLTWTNLTEANLTWTNLTEANLHQANLHQANLIKANLHQANLFRANLTEAELRSADLGGHSIGLLSSSNK